MDFRVSESTSAYTQEGNVLVFDNVSTSGNHMLVINIESINFGRKEDATGKLIVEEFKRMEKDPIAVPAVLCKNHGPFAWGKDPHEAVHNAVVLEEVAKMAYRAELINPRIQPAPQELQDKHYFRKHGANAYYGQDPK